MITSPVRSIYRANNAKPSLGIEFASQEERDQFYWEVKIEADVSGLKLPIVIYGDGNKLFIEASNYPENPLGCYISNGKEFSINLGNNQFRNFVCAKMNITKEHALLPAAGDLRDNTIYFKPPTLQNIKSEIKLSSSSVSSAYAKPITPMANNKSNEVKKVVEQPIVINGHGTKTNKTFVIKNHTLFAPGDLNNPYIFSVDQNYNIESDFRVQKLKPVVNGQWTVYKEHLNDFVPDVILNPWNSDELQKLAGKILNNANTWSKIDNQQQYYLDRDSNAQLIVKKGASYVHLDPKQAKIVFQKIVSNTYDFVKEGIPAFFYAPKVGKIKILSTIKLSQVLEELNKIGNSSSVMLATCNATNISNPVIMYNSKGTALSITDIINDSMKNKKQSFGH